jgi:Kdo2-lipid IVA lauroyltransferase/acyltransferase
VPFPILHGISNALYFILFHLLRYRRRVVSSNLSNAFPQKTDNDLNEISRKFYRHLCDVFLETFKAVSMTEQEMRERCTMHPDAVVLLNSFYEKQQSVVLVLGHWGNWEWGGHCFALACNHPLFGIYHPIANPYLDSWMQNVRTRFGMRLIAMNQVLREMVKYRKQPTATAFIADQTPSSQNALRISFMNQPSLVFRGPEAIAVKFGYPVIYVSVRKIARSRYVMNAEVLCELPEQTNEGAITELHVRRLEQDINAAPEYWLWSHRRWKHNPND